MKVHHVNCGSMSPRFADDHVCHVLILETRNGLVLVDSGFGLDDIRNPRARVGAIRHLIRPRLDPAETAISHVRALGFDPADVRHIIATHLDIDHIGGLSDFPQATLHATVTEVDSAYSTRLASKIRYQRDQLPTTQESIVRHLPTADAWNGFVGVKELTEVSEDILLIPMPGHTRGHAAVAVGSDTGWVLHCGDSYYHRNSLTGSSAAPAMSRLFERLAAEDWPRVRANHDALAQLYQTRGHDLRIVCAHDRMQLEMAQDSQYSSPLGDLPNTEG